MKSVIIFCTLLIGFAMRMHAQTIPYFIPHPGLVAWYPCSGNMNDSSGFGHNGYPNSGVSFGTDRFGVPNHAYVGNGMSWAQVPQPNNFPTGNASRSVSVYFRLPAASLSVIVGGRSMINWGDNTGGGRFGIYASDTMIGLEYTGAAVTTHYVADTNWHNLVVTYPVAGSGPASVKIYLDGNLSTPVISGGPLAAFNTDTGSWHSIGGSPFFGSSYQDSWDGYIDDIGVWNRELTPCEIWHIAHSVDMFQPDAITGPDSVCVGDTIVLYDAVAGGAWQTLYGNATASASGVITGVASGLDSVIYSSAESCAGYTASRYIYVKALANAGHITGFDTVCVLHSEVILDSASGGTWSCANGNATISSGGILTGVTPGTDTVFYTASNSCGDQIAAFPVVVATTGICDTLLRVSAPTDNSPFLIYPNPVKGKFTLHIKHTGEAIIAIDDQLGRNLFHTIAGSDNTVDMLSDKFPPGIYFVTCTFNGNTFHQRLIIE